MKTGMEQLRMAAHGIALLKIGLRSHSKQIQRVLKAANPFSEMKSRIPSELLGMELQDVLGPVLRSLLSDESNHKVQPAPSYRGIPDQIPENTTINSGDFFSQLLQPSRTETAANNEQPSAFASNGSVEEKELRKPTHHHEISSDQMRILNRQRIVQPDSQGRQLKTSTAALQHSHAPSPDHSDKAVTLRETVSRYWTNQNQSNQTPTGSDAHHFLPISPNGLFANVPEDQRARPQRWDEITGRSAANQILNSINSDPKKHAPRTEQDIQIGPDDRLAVRNIFHIHVPPDANSNLRTREDLSNSLADLLREQAIDHGIDVP